MKKVEQTVVCICTFIFIWMIFGMRLYAEENEKLVVDITLQNGESVLIMPGHYFPSAVPVIFTVPDTGDSYYSISTDDGNSFGMYVKMDDDNVMLYPDDATAPDGRWQIRFANVCEGIERTSDIYRISFDVTSPVIECTGSGRFRVSDDTGLGRCTVTCGDEITDEEVFDDEEPVRDYETELTQDGRIRYGDVIMITARDLAGNETVLSYEYMLDEGMPSLQTHGIDDGGRYGEAVVLKAEAADNESEAYVNYTCERVTDDEVITTSGYNLSGDTGISFDEDGIYSVVLYASDSAGNESGRTRIGFMIDRTAPTVRFDGVSDGVDIRSEAGISIDVYDNLYEETAVDISMTRTALGDRQNILLQSYDLNASHDIRDVYIRSDGEYELSVRATDGTGNVTAERCRFRIDKTPPDISVTGIREGEYTNEKSVLRFNAGEMFYDSTIMEAVLEKKTAGQYVKVSDSSHVMRSERDYMDISVDSEGEYRLTCTASDRSGNRSQQAVTFTVDYTPPVISEISGIDNSFIKSFSLTRKIAEYVSDASPVFAKAFLNDSEYAGGDVVIEEGRYVLTLIAEDAASNTSSETVSFIVDHTAPQIVLSGFDRNGNIRKGGTVKVGLLDEEDRLESVGFNGRNIAIDSDNTATVAVDDYGHYVLTVRASDAAGNVTDTSIATECYMYGGLFDGYSVEEKTITLPAADAKDDLDLRGLVIGLMSVLSGTFGLTYRTYMSGK